MKLYMLFVEESNYDYYRYDFIGVYSSKEEREKGKEQYLFTQNYNVSEYEEFDEFEVEINQPFWSEEDWVEAIELNEKNAHMYNDHGLWKQFLKKGKK